jgi:hypothetical protein
LLIAIAYSPRIVHIAREVLGGVSVNAWSLWLFSSVLILVHALVAPGVVFIVLQSVNILAIVTITVLAKRYEHMVCRPHERHAEAR